MNILYGSIHIIKRWQRASTCS